jgi:hypothetical protein
MQHLDELFFCCRPRLRRSIGANAAAAGRADDEGLGTAWLSQRRTCPKGMHTVDRVDIRVCIARA